MQQISFIGVKSKNLPAKVGNFLDFLEMYVCRFISFYGKFLIYRLILSVNVVSISVNEA